MTIHRDHLKSSLGASYRIEREIAGDGMSHVFVAEETALGRRVVIVREATKCARSHVSAARKG